MTIPISARTWVASKSLNAKLPQTEIFRSDSGVIRVPESVRVSGCNTVVNEFGRYHYSWWIEEP